jgi:predicted Zn-dependent peptidase
MYQKTVLANNLRVLTHDMKQRDSISIGIWVGVGGRFEADRIKGAAHFLEHIVFKGSKNYSCEHIKEKIEGVGGALNAFTSEEMTCYYAKIPAAHLKQTFDVLADMVYSPMISVDDMEKEKTVVIEEIKMYNDLPQYLVMDYLDGLLWPDHPLGKSLAGSVETVSAFTQNDLREFHQQFYNPSNIVVVACGKVDHQQLVNLVKKKSFSAKPQKIPAFRKAENSQNSPRIRLFKKDFQQMHIAIGVPSYHESHKDRYALHLLNVILGGNMSSRLFVELRENKGWAYSVSSASKSLRDTGVFLIRAGVDNSKAVEAVELILKELKKIKESSVSEDEFKRAKDYILGQLVIGLEDTMEQMLWLGEGMVSKNKIRRANEVVKEIKRVTIKDIKRVAQDVFSEKRFNLAAVGPLTEEQEKGLKELIRAE